jgi:hypothetical protein
VDKHRLPEPILPELRGKWMTYMGARLVADASVKAANECHTVYLQTLNTVLRLNGLDPATNWKVNLETGEVSQVTEQELAHMQQGDVPFVPGDGRQ